MFEMSVSGDQSISIALLMRVVLIRVQLLQLVLDKTA